MKDKKLFYMTFLVCVVAIFAYFVLASSTDDLLAISVVSPTSDTNYSATITLNASTYNGTDYANATNMTFSFYNSTSGTLVYNVSVLPRINSTAGYGFLGPFFWSNVTYNTTVDTITLLSDGTYNLSVNATNGSKSSVVNVENSTFTTIQIDNSNPVVTINTPANNTFYSTASGGTSSFVVNVTATDSGVGISDVNITNDSNGGATTYLGGNVTKSNDYYNITYNTTQLGEGVHNITIIVNDTLGNSNDSEFVIVNVDLTAPTVSLNDTSVLQNWTWTDDTTPDLEYSFTDGFSPNASCELFVDGTGYGVNSSALNDTRTIQTVNATLAAGTHSWYVNCTDLGNNLGSSGTTFANKFYFDVATVTVVTPLNNTFTNDTDAGNVSFNFSYASGFVNTTLTDNNVSCELWITNSSGDYIANGVNNTALNNTVMTITNNQSLVNNVSMNWTINCTYNNSVITAVDNDFYKLGVDNETPYSLVASCTEVAIGADRLCTCSASDNSEAIGGTLTYTYTGDSTATAGTTTTTCTATDPVGLITTGTASYTVTAASSSSSSSSGGSSSSQSVGVYAKEVWNSVEPGTTTTLEVKNGEIGITAVEFDISKKVYGAWMKVEKKNSLPSSVKSFSGDTYRKIQITKGSALKEDVLVNPTIDFKVSKSWLTKNKIGKANVALHRYVDDDWVELSTTMGEDDGTYIYYTAKTPGFSYFIIGEKVKDKVVAEEVADADVAAEEEVVDADVAAEEEVVDADVAAEEEAPSKFPWKWAVVIVVLVIAIAVLIWLSKKK